MTSSFRCTGKLLNQRHTHTHIHQHTGIQDPYRNITFTCYKCSRCYFCYAGVMWQVRRVFRLHWRKRWPRCRLTHWHKEMICLVWKKVNIKTHKTVFCLTNKKKNPDSLELPVVHLSFYTTVLNPLLQTHLRVYAIIFPCKPIPINSDENFSWAFLE